MDANFNTYEVSAELAEELKINFYEGGKYQDKDTKAIIYPLSNGTFIFSAVPGRKLFILKSENEFFKFKNLIKPNVDLKSDNVFIRMQDYTFDLMMENTNSFDLITSKLGTNFIFKLKNKLPENIDEAILYKISQTRSQDELTNLFFLVGLYLGEFLKMNQNFKWVFKLKYGVPQYFIPQMFNDNKRNKIGIWPIVFRDIKNKKLRPIDQIIKRLNR